MTHDDVMMFVFPLCSRQKPWATGVRTLKIRPTGRRCSSPPKRVAARLSFCFCLNVSVLVEPGGCLFGRGRLACLRRASRVGGVIFFLLLCFWHFRLEEEDEEKRRVSAGSHTTTTTTTEVLKLHTAFRETFTNSTVSVQTIKSNVEEKKSGFCFLCVFIFNTAAQTFTNT